MGKSSKRKRGRKAPEQRQHDHPGGDPRRQDLPPSLRGLKDDDEVSVTLVPAGTTPPEGSVGELIGSLTKGGHLDDGTVIPAGSKIYRSIRETTRAEIAAAPGALTLTLDDFAGYREDDPASGPDLAIPPRPDQADMPSVAQRLTEAAPGLASKLAQGLSRDELQQLGPEIARAMHAAGAAKGAYTFTDHGPARPERVQAQVVTGGERDDGEPGLPAGMLPGDIIATEQPLGFVETAIQLPEGGEIKAGSKVYRVATYESGGQGAPFPPYQQGKLERIRARQLETEAPPMVQVRREVPQKPRPGPEIIITDNLDDLDTSEVDMVIEDLDPDNPDDAGRVLIGRPEQVRRYHERERELDARARPDVPGEDGAPRSQAEAEVIRLQTGWKADTVLGHHAWLTHHYRHPADAQADYLALLMRETVRQDHRGLGLFWPVDLSGGPADIPEGRQLAQVIARGLGDADTFQVTAPMCTMMRDSWDAQQVRGALPLDEGEMPVPAGFCWLDKPWLYRENLGHWLPARAVSWERTVARIPDADGRPVLADAIRMVLWLSVADTIAFGQWDDPARAERVVTRIGQVVPHRVMLLPFGMSYQVKGGDTALTGILGLLHTLWMYLGMELPRSRPVPASAPAVRRRAQKSLKHNQVHIITLRKYDYIGDRPAHFPQLRNFTCRWPVDKFYRHIDYYEDEDAEGRRRHKAIPALRSGTVLNDDHDICAVCLANDQTVRITLVHGHIRGPSNMPFRTPARDRTLQKLSR